MQSRNLALVFLAGKASIVAPRTRGPSLACNGVIFGIYPYSDFRLRIALGGLGDESENISLYTRKTKKIHKSDSTCVYVVCKYQQTVFSGETALVVLRMRVVLDSYFRVTA